MTSVADGACDTRDDTAVVLPCGEPAPGVGGRRRKLQRLPRLMQLLHCGFVSSHYFVETCTVSLRTMASPFLYATSPIRSGMIGVCNTFTLRALQSAQPLRDFLWTLRGGPIVLGSCSLSVVAMLRA